MLLLYYFTIGVVSALALELFKLYELYEKLEESRLQAMLRSWVYWALMLGMITASGFVVLVLNADDAQAPTARLFAYGIAARSIAREIASAVVVKATSRVKLGMLTVDPRSPAAVASAALL